MGAPRIWEHDVYQGEDLEPLDRMVGRDNAVLVEADVDSIDIYVYPLDGSTALYSATGLDPGAVTNPNNRVFDTLQTDGRWEVDSTGYNSRQLIPYSSFSSGLPAGKGVRVEILFQTSAWNTLHSVHKYNILTMKNAVAS